MSQDKWLRSVVILVSILTIAYIVPHFFKDGERTISIESPQLSGISALIAKSDSIPKEKVIEKIEIYLGGAIDEPILTDIPSLLRPYDIKEFITVLTSVKLKLRSFFWLGGPYQAFEIIFWSIFGVLASILYTGSEAIRDKDFRSNEVAVHVAKLFYAPLCTIVIILSIGVLSANGDVSIEKFQYWLIVLSFILGFFSGRTVELLNRIKDLILPLGKWSDATTSSKIALKGSIVLDPATTQGIAIDLTKSAVKILSMSDAALNDITNPKANGEFLFNGLVPGDYIIHVEYKNGNDVFEGSAPVKLPLANEEDVISVPLSKTV
ncbi:hypothetical protein [Chryseolinea lacunae]|uniref:Carboxypeptidase regulatory-like domain-containing protein n=1 Tax=Chryseolinea lacunae TaxID=2801331 RepID=A0ABS1L5Y4_9BACT|nr:hypothetical protein [Chryseolinea lacunae]MBL0745941.1 hypothetical protein [Chryseolinea lacunae]